MSPTRPVKSPAVRIDPDNEWAWCGERRLYARVSVTERMGLHRRLGERLERGYRPERGEIAARHTRGSTEGHMSETPEVDKGSFPGGYDITEIIAAVKLAAMRHVERDKIPLGELEQAIVDRFLKELVARHPETLPSGDPYLVRAQELFEERRSLLHSHLEMSWFGLAYWAYGLLAVRSGLSIAEYDNLAMFVSPVQRTLRELGVQLSEEECLEEIDRFLPRDVSPRSVEASTQTFLSFVRFLHRAALRRRQLVTPGLTLPSVCLAYAEHDAAQADSISTFLAGHGVDTIRRPEEGTQAARLLVLLSRAAVDSEPFWRGLAAWKLRPVVPMVVCLMPKAALYGDPPSGVPTELWAWLGHNVAVELTAETDRYVVLLRALDSPDPKQWWWHEGDAIELGLAVDVLGTGIPRPPTRRRPAAPTREAYPYAVDGTLLSAFFLASERLARDEASGRDARYFTVCGELLEFRQAPGGRPYALPWFVLIYRTWLAFAGRLPGFAYSEADAAHAERELQSALFALGIGTQPAEVPTFLHAFAELPWTSPASSIAGVRRADHGIHGPRSPSFPGGAGARSAHAATAPRRLVLHQLCAARRGHCAGARRTPGSQGRRRLVGPQRHHPGGTTRRVPELRRPRRHVFASGCDGGGRPEPVRAIRGRVRDPTGAARRSHCARGWPAGGAPDAAGVSPWFRRSPPSRSRCRPRDRVRCRPRPAAADPGRATPLAAIAGRIPEPAHPHHQGSRGSRQATTGLKTRPELELSGWLAPRGRGRATRRAAPP